MSKIHLTPQIERVARAICRARGQDPDEVVVGTTAADFFYPKHNGQPGPMSSYSGLRWETFGEDAFVFVEALKAAHMQEAPPPSEE